MILPAFAAARENTNESPMQMKTLLTSENIIYLVQSLPDLPLGYHLHRRFPTENNLKATPLNASYKNIDLTAGLGVLLTLNPALYQSVPLLKLSPLAAKTVRHHFENKDWALHPVSNSSKDNHRDRNNEPSPGNDDETPPENPGGDGGTLPEDSNEDDSDEEDGSLPGDGDQPTEGDEDTNPPSPDEDEEPVINYTLSLTLAVFDKKVENQRDITVTILPNINGLLDIKNWLSVLTKDTGSGGDYLVVDNTVTIKKEYLASQNEGDILLAFNFAAETAPTLTVTITDTTPVDITPPIYKNAKINASNKFVTLIFDENLVSNHLTEQALKGAVSYASDGVNFRPLRASDTLRISNNTLVITFEQALSGADNRIKVSDGALKDETGNILTQEVVTDKIDTTRVTVAASDANGAPLELKETTLESALIRLTLTNDAFVTEILKEDFLMNLPGGSIKSVHRVSATKVDITLAYDGRDFDNNNLYFEITVLPRALSRSSTEVTPFSIKVTPQAEAVFAAQPNGSPLSLTKGTLNNAIVRLTLINDTFKQEVSTIDFEFPIGLPGLSIGAVTRVSDTMVYLTLAYDGTNFATPGSFNLEVLKSGLTRNSEKLWVPSITVR